MHGYEWWTRWFAVASEGVNVTKALCVTAGTEQVASIRKARELGLRVVAIDGRSDAPGLNEADIGIVLDPRLEEEVLELAVREGIQLILPVPIGRLLTTIGAVNDALGLPGVTRQAALNCTDKLLFRKKLTEYGLIQTEYTVAREREEIIDVLRTFPLPCVLKPRFGSGSRAVVVIYDRSDIETLVDQHLRSRSDLDETLIEEYIDGSEVGVDAAVTSGTVTVISARVKSNTQLPYRQTVGYYGPAPLTAAQFDQLRNVVKDTVEATGVDNSLLQLDMILRDNAPPFVIEMAPRPAGLRMAELMVPAMTGIDLLSEGIKMLLGAPIDFQPRHSQPVALRFLQFRAGLVRSVPDCDWVSKQSGVLHFSCNIKPGDRLREITTGADVLARGYVMTTGSDLTYAISLADNIMSQVCSATEVI